MLSSVAKVERHKLKWHSTATLKRVFHAKFRHLQEIKNVGGQIEPRYYALTSRAECKTSWNIPLWTQFQFWSQNNTIQIFIQNRLNDTLRWGRSWCHWHQTTRSLGTGGRAPRIVNFGTAWRFVGCFTTRPPYPLEITPSRHWTGGWVSPSAALDSVAARRNIFCPCRESILGHLTRSQSLTDWDV
jgi:hypothetical protein